ncbi:tetratricopeptide repeat protein [Spirochaeta isovalerica]|uniref:Tetratricopeptide (TPR) repeat protein n=1 Tax=Spirochaeta isovalerica TaxID=150 RepID=A0A841RBF3_9SPIO|nr:tetratricopeptide repeat protein [Spirochaeta isovalerica]MBB6481263.1 tetratricopeptide (TPR) repeat protein [Spirochaeta isovalerica]
MKKHLFILVFLILGQISFAVDLSNPHIAESERLISLQKYETAFQYLTTNESGISHSDLVVQKVKILLNYFVHSTMHQMFALKDIPEGESVYDYRGREGRYQYVMYKPDEALLSALESDSSNGELYFWLGQFYYEVLEKYNGQWLLGNDKLQSKIIENYELANLNNFSDKILFSNLGQIQLQIESYEKAIENLRKALDYEKDNPGYNHNLAVAYLNTGEMAKALPYAEKALNSYSDTYYKSDSCYLAGIIAINLQDFDKSISYMEKGKALEPDQYRFYDKLIDLYLYKKNFAEAKENSRYFFELYPTNPSVMGSIVNYYNGYKALNEARILIDELLALTEEPEARGNLYYHKALVSDAMGDHQEALAQLKQAEEMFREVYEDDHQVFQAIGNLIDQIK